MACLIPRCPTSCQPAPALLCIPTGNAVITERRNTFTIDNSATKPYQTKTPTPYFRQDRRVSAHLVRLLIDPRFDGEESPNPNPQERDTHHQRHHTQCLNAGQLQPPHSRNTNNKKSHRGPDVRQQRTLVRQLSPLPSQPVSNSCVQFLRHRRSANPHRNNIENEAQQTRREGRAKKRGARGRGG